MLPSKYQNSQAFEGLTGRRRTPGVVWIYRIVERSGPQPPVLPIDGHSHLSKHAGVTIDQWFGRSAWFRMATQASRIGRILLAGWRKELRSDQPQSGFGAFTTLSIAVTMAIRHWPGNRWMPRSRKEELQTLSSQRGAAGPKVWSCVPRLGSFTMGRRKSSKNSRERS
jgi:hypothetical protein